MPLEHILRAMQAQADGEIEKITQRAEEEAAQLVAEAQAEAETIQARHRARVEPMLAAEAASILNKAKLGALRASANAREQLLIQAFTGAEECLAQMRASGQYAQVFRALAREALEGLEGDLVAYVDPRDVEMATGVFAQLAIQPSIEAQPTPLGGVSIATRDGRITIVNTVASRLERARGALRGPVAAILTLGHKEDTDQVQHPEADKEWKTSTAMPMPA